MNTSVVGKSAVSQFVSLAKPRVVSLIVFCAVIGMFLATPGMPPLQVLVFGTLGIALTAGSAAAVNCLLERHIDAQMMRTRGRPLPSGVISSSQTVTFAFLVGGSGLVLLHHFVNPLTMWLTVATFVGYAFIYTLLLKPNTPQNIVIGGASGAMPPVLGWAAVTGQVTLEPMLLFLIIFMWTPPHFWSLALYRVKDYERAGLPMLPVTHGSLYTRWSIVFYTCALIVVSCMPYFTGMNGVPYLVSALLLGAIFLARAVKMLREYSDAWARGTFKFSILYLALLFAALLVDHYLV
jgi:protoheme IX farnesyltransferase